MSCPTLLFHVIKKKVPFPKDFDVICSDVFKVTISGCHWAREEFKGHLSVGIRSGLLIRTCLEVPALWSESGVDPHSGNLIWPAGGTTSMENKWSKPASHPSDPQFIDVKTEFQKEVGDLSKVIQ